MFNGFNSNNESGERLIPSSPTTNEKLSDHQQPPSYYTTFYPNPDQGSAQPDISGFSQPSPMSQPYVQQPTGAPTVLLVVNSPTPRTDPAASYVCHIVMSCFVFWCCGWLFGLIAFFLAIYAQNLAGSGNAATARTYGKASMILSIIGLVFGIALIIVLIVGKSQQVWEKIQESNEVQSTTEDT